MQEEWISPETNVPEAQKAATLRAEADALEREAKAKDSA